MFRPAFRLVLAAALLAACAGDPVSAYPPGPAKTLPNGARADASPGCPVSDCSLAPPRILISDTTDSGDQHSINPDGSADHAEATFARGGTWMPGASRDSYVAAGWFIDHGEDICLYAIGKWGCQHRYTLDPAEDLDPAPSPDGRVIAFTSNRPKLAGQGGPHRIYTVPASPPPFAPAESKLVQLTFGDGDDRWPHYSPDGRYIVFASDRTTGPFQLRAYHVWRMTAAGGDVQQLSNVVGRHPVYSPDGTTVAFTTPTAGGDRIALVPAAGGPVAIVQNGLTSSYRPSWSPDGKRIAFGSADPAWEGIDVMNADGTNVTHVAKYRSVAKWSR